MSAPSKEPIWTSSFSLLLGGFLLQGMSFYILLVVLPLFVVEVLDKGAAEVGFVVGIFSLTAVLTRPLGGFLLDRFGRRLWLIGGSVLFTLSMFAYMFDDSYGLLIGNRLLHGLAWGLVSVSATTVASDLVPAARRGTGMGYWGMAMPLALATGPLLGSILMQENTFAGTFMACGLLSSAALLSFSLVRCPEVRDRQTRLRWKTMLEARVGRLFAFMLLLCMGYGGVVAFAPLYAPRVGFESAAPLFSAWAAGALLARIPGGKLYDSLGPRLPGLVGLVLLVITWLTLGLWQSKVGMLVSAAGLGFGFGLLMPGVQAMAVDLVEPARRGAANATLFSAFDVGIAIGAMGFGQLAKVADLSVVFLISSGLAGVGIVLYLFWVMPHFKRNRL